MAGQGRVHSASSPSCVSRSLDRTLLDAQDTCELKLSGRKLKDYPKAAAKYNLSDTVLADLSRNRLSEVPCEVTEYRSLETLNLYQNVIKHLPESLSSLQGLTHLNLSRNQLSVIPGVVCELAGLRVLDVSGNRLVSLPEELGHLHNLMQLDASYNQLAHLPPPLGELDSLRSLNLRRNHLQTLPPELCFLRLVFLDLSGNRISTLPTELRFMGSLVTLALDNNPLQHPPASLCTRGRVHIFKRLEMIAAKEDKKRGILSTETDFKKPLHKPSSCTDFRLVNGFFDPRPNKRSTVDSGYNTCDSVDQRWSQESQESVEYEDSRKLAMRAAACTKEQRQERGRGGAGGSVRPLNGLPNGDIVLGVNGGDHTATTTPSALSTPSTLSPGDGFDLTDEFNKALKLRQDYENVFSTGDHTAGKATQSHSGAVWGVGGSGSSSSSSSSSTNNHTSSNGGLGMRHPPEHTHPHNPDPGGGFILPHTHPTPHHPHAHIPTYREYVEAKLQRRAMESNNIYRRQGSDGAAPVAENGTHRSAESLAMRTEHITTQPSRPGPIGAAKSCNGLDGYSQRLSSQPRLQDLTREDMTRADVKALQKEAVLSYIKSRVSPSKGSSSPNSPNASFDSGDSGPSFPPPGAPPTITTTSHHQHPTTASTTQHYASSPYSTNNLYTSTPHPGSSRGGGGGIGPTPPKGNASSTTSTTTKTRKRSGGGRPFDPDAAHLSFTYRRELEKQQHEKQLVENLRNIIETRLKVSLPADISSALMDGVVLCHLANHVRPRSVSSIHVPSPAVPKLTIAKCRLNVENFLEACRKIGVEDEYTCTAHDILEERGTVRVAITVERLLQFYQGRHTPLSPRNQTPV